MNGPFLARYSDGLTPAEQTLKAVFQEEQWQLLHPQQAAEFWFMRDLNCQVQAEGLLYTRKNSDATLLVLFQDQQLSGLPGYQSLYHQKGSKKALLIGSFLLLTVLAVTLVVLSIKPLSYEIANRISPQQERDIFGKIFLESTFIKQGCEDTEARNVLKELGESLSVEERKSGPIDFILVDWKAPNAFAFPGRKIVVTRGLLAQVENSEQLAAIIGHELGHLQLRHNLGEFIRSSLSAVIWGLLVGDFSGAFVVDPSLMKQLGERAYSRELEAEADHYSAQRMLEQGFDPKALGNGLKAIAKSLDEDSPPDLVKKILSMFSSHPETAERIAHLEAKYPKIQGRQPLSEKQWHILHTACAVLEDRTDP